jgi:hypothetical protein
LQSLGGQYSGKVGIGESKNHIAVDHMVKKFVSDVLVPHGYIEIYLHNKWIKATYF